MKNMTHPYIFTHSGKKFVIEELEPDMIDIESIAHGLAKECRFAGQINEHYSVARHSIIMRNMLSRDLPSSQWIYPLLHDAAEAYLGDVPKPIKVRLPDYNELEAKVMAVIAQKFELDIELFDSPHIHMADSRIVLDEAINLFPSEPSWVADFYEYGIFPFDIDIKPQSWKKDFNEFCDLFFTDYCAHLKELHAA